MERPELPEGATADASWIVEEKDLASALSDARAGSFPRVFSTSRMVALMELAAARVLRPILSEGELTVGVRVDVSHMAATPPGARVRATARYRGREGKFYVFEVAAFDPAGEIGRGLHQRAIIDAARLSRGAEKRAAGAAEAEG